VGADEVYAPTGVDAAIASGSFRTLGLVVVPCSMRSLEIATGVTSTLLPRAADVKRMAYARVANA